MTHSVKLLSALATVLAISLTIASQPATARILCKDGLQVVQGQLLATPYCQDALVGEIARARGFKVSDHEIRWNYSRKMEICRVIGRDIRISGACIDAFEHGRGPRS